MGNALGEQTTDMADPDDTIQWVAESRQRACIAAIEEVLRRVLELAIMPSLETHIKRHEVTDLLDVMLKEAKDGTA